MQSPAVSYAASPPTSTLSIVSNGDESSNEEDESSTEELNDMVGDIVVTEEIMKDRREGNDLDLLDHQPIAPGTNVSTLYGEGSIVKCHHLDKVYIISLPFGATAYLHPNAVLCTIICHTKSSLTQHLLIFTIYHKMNFCPRSDIIMTKADEKNSNMPVSKQPHR